MAPQRICSIPDCGKPRHARTWCGSHYQRWTKFGDPTGGGPDRPLRGSLPGYLEDVVMTFEEDDCLLWPFAKTNAGYGVIRMDGKNVVVSRYVCERVHGRPPTPEHEAAHSCGNGHLGCVSLKHLSWKTPVENQADRIIHGTTNRGERHGMSKLTKQDVLNIRSSQETNVALAHRYGVGVGSINNVLARRTWGWLA